MRLVLCDRNRILSESLAAALQARGHQVVAIATTVAEGLAAVAAYQPDLVLLDVCCPAGTECPGPGEAEGLSATALLRRRCPRVSVLLLASPAAATAWPAATAAGAAGLLSKDKRVSEIAEAVELIAHGGKAIGPGLAGRHTQRPAARRTRMVPQLTPREQEVLRRIVAGQSTGQMAREMDLTVATLRTYVKNLLSKLGAHSRLQAAALATQAAALATQADPPDKRPARPAVPAPRAPAASPSGREPPAQRAPATSPSGREPPSRRAPATSPSGVRMARQAGLL